MAVKRKPKKASKAKKKSNPIKSIVAFFRDKRFRQIVGFLLLVFSAYFLIALTSFLFTWKADQDLLSGSWSEFLFNPDITVENWLGKLGAMLSHQFMHNWFGISSYLFVLIFFLLSFRILFRVSLLPLKRTTAISLFMMLWVSITLGYLFQNSSWLFLGGAFGYHITQWLTGILGSIGTGIFIVFTFTVFLILSFNINFDWLKDLLAKPEATESEDGFIVEHEESEEAVVMDFSDDEEPETILDLPTSEEVEEEIRKEEEEDNAFEAGSDTELSIEPIAAKEETLSVDEVNSQVKEFGEYDPKLDLAKYQFPTIDLLNDYGGGTVNVDRKELEANKNTIVDTLGNYKIEIDKIKATIGPSVTLYEIIPAPGTRISKIKNLEDDIALSLSALGIRIIAPMPGKGTIGIEVPNKKPETVGMRTLIASEKFQNTDMDLPVALGKNISNQTYIADLAKMPHLLMAGATGQGKSVGLNGILISLLYKKHPSQIKFILVDPKKVELTLFNKIERHYLAKLPDSAEAIITDTKQVVNTLNSLCIEMDQRYELLKVAQVRNIKEYNAKFISRKLNPNNGHRYMPYIILVVDEFADLIMTAGKEIEAPIARIAQLARAIGIHLIIATQRPSVNIITGTIKANFPTRIAYRVTSKIDSRTILDTGGAEQLVGRGDMLLAIGSELIRLQCAFVDTPEVDTVTEFIGNQRGYSDSYLLPEYVDESATSGGDMDASDRDALFEEAASIVVLTQQGSASLLQRRLKLGYNRAGRIVDQLESAGIIGPFEGSKARQVLIPDEYSLEQFLKPNNENDDK